MKNWNLPMVMELNEYIVSEEFKKEMKELQMPVSVEKGGQTGY